MDAVIKDLETRMQVAADLLSREFAGVRTGRASTGLLDAVRVEGLDAPALQSGGDGLRADARTLVIQPCDAPQISDSRRRSSSRIGLTPRMTASSSGVMRP